MVCACLVALSAQAAASPSVGPQVTLSRAFHAGERVAYGVSGSLIAESRAQGLDTWIPTNISMSYGFTVETRRLEADGIAEVRYRRPTFTEVEGQDFDAAPKRHVEHVDDNLLITLSPINQILDVKPIPAGNATARQPRRVEPLLARGKALILSRLSGRTQQLAEVQTSGPWNPLPLAGEGRVGVSDQTLQNSIKWPPTFKNVNSPAGTPHFSEWTESPLMMRAFSSHVNRSNAQSAFDPGTFIRELHRIAICVGGFDTALDFNPKLPLDPVSVGDTWKQTIGYQPQDLSGAAKGKKEIQRLDYTFTYRGLIDSDGKRVQRIDAQVRLNTDLGAFINQMMKTKPEDSGLEKIPIHINADIAFDLDPKSLRTLRATAKSEGGFQIFLHEHPDSPAYEEKFRGRTTEKLLARSNTPKA